MSIRSFAQIAVAVFVSFSFQPAHQAAASPYALSNAVLSPIFGFGKIMDSLPNDPQTKNEPAIPQTQADADKMENTLKLHPDDFDTRAVLMEFYYWSMINNPDAHVAHERHVLWVIIPPGSLLACKMVQRESLLLVAYWQYILFINSERI